MVGRPISHRGLAGKVLLERVSKEVVVSKLIAYQNFRDDVLLNDAIKIGE